MGSYEIIDATDTRMPSTARNGTPFLVLAEHDTEGGTGPAGAEGTIAFLINTASQRNASYHEVISYEPARQRFRVYVIVPGNRAAHSIHPVPPTYSPDAVVRAALGQYVGNPNQAVYAQSIAGRIADVNAYSTDRFFLASMHRRARELIGAHKTITKRAEHFRFNPATRTDWGKLLTPALGGIVIPTTLPGVDMPPPFVRKLFSVRVPMQKGAAVRTEPRIADDTFSHSLGENVTLEPFGIAKGDSWTSNAGPMKGVASDEWYAYVGGTSLPATILYVHVGNRADAERNIVAQKDAAISRIIPVAKGVVDSLEFTKELS